MIACSESSPADARGDGGSAGISSSSGGSGGGTGGTSGAPTGTGGAVSLPDGGQPDVSFPPPCPASTAAVVLGDGGNACSTIFDRPGPPYELKRNLVNITFDAGDAGEAVMPFVGSLDQCGNDLGWAYAAEDGTEVDFCPAVCALAADAGALEVEVLFGCSAPVPLP